MKKRLAVIAVILICFSIIGTGTYAWFATRGVARNVITTGAIKISVMEEQLVDGTVIDYPGAPIPVMPATTVSKIVSVRNEEEDAYIRMTYAVRVLDAEGNEMQSGEDPLGNIVFISPNSDEWTEKDGWWYYNRALAAGESTTPLFEEVRFSGTGMDNSYQNSTIIVMVHAQSVQVANNPAPGGDVTAVHGWPRNRKW